MAIEDFSPLAAGNRGLIPPLSPADRIYTWFWDLFAGLRTWYNDAQWVIYGDGDGKATITRLSATSFSVSGANLTGIYEANRRVKITGTTTGTVFGSITSSSFASNATTVVVALDSGSLANETLTVFLSILTVSGSAIPGGQSAPVLGTAAAANLGTSGATVPLLSSPAIISSAWNFTAIPAISGNQLGNTVFYNTGTVAGTIPINGTATSTVTSAGLVELATALETYTGADFTRAMTPGFFAANSDLGTPGFYVLPGGLTVMWGNNSASGSADTAVTFPGTFPNICYVVIGTCERNFTGSDAATFCVKQGTLSTTGFSFNTLNTVNGTRLALIGRWFAVGR